MKAVLFKQQIADLVLQGRVCYEDLNIAERRRLAAALIREQEPIWKGSLLTDCDYDTPLLPDLVAQAIESGGRDPYFIDEIEKALEERRAAVERPKDWLEALYREDCAKRAIDMQAEINKHRPDLC